MINFYTIYLLIYLIIPSLVYECVLCVMCVYVCYVLWVCVRVCVMCYGYECMCVMCVYACLCGRNPTYPSYHRYCSAFHQAEKCMLLDQRWYVNVMSISVMNRHTLLGTHQRHKHIHIYKHYIYILGFRIHTVTQIQKGWHTRARRKEARSNRHRWTKILNCIITLAW